MAQYEFQFHTYQRQFRQPLQTSHGIWQFREGIIINLTDATGKAGWGEIAPIPWFNSETLAMAAEFCQQLGAEVSLEKIKNIPDTLPACQFAFESAVTDILTSSSPVREDNCCYSYLLPAGETALTATRKAKEEQTWKWKIGVLSFEEEIAIFWRLLEILPTGTKLRLDANGGLSLAETRRWLQVADEVGIVEFIEQPLPPNQFPTMLALAEDYQTTIALDESVSQISQLEQCYQQGWRGVYVIKAAIAGSPQRLRKFCQQHSLDTVFSSVFETKIGRKAVLRLATEISNPTRALGFGVDRWLVTEDERNFSPSQTT